MDRVHLSKTDGRLILTKSKAFYNHQISRMIIGIIVWGTAWFFFLVIVQASVTAIVFIGLLILLVPLILIPKLSDYAEIANNGQIFAFDRNSNQLSCNGVFIAPINNIAYLQVYTHIARGPYEYSLFAVLENNQKIRIDRAINGREVFGLAEEIAKYLQVKIMTKDRLMPDNQMEEHVFEGRKSDLVTLEDVKTKIQGQSSHRFQIITLLFSGILGGIIYFFYRLGKARR